MLCAEWVCIAAKKTQASDSPVFYRRDACKHALEGDMIFIILDSEQICSLSWRETLYLPRMFAIQIFLKRQSGQKLSVPLLPRCADLLETHEELSPNIITNVCFKCITLRVGER